MASSFMALINRTKHLNRWQLMRNNIPENVKEHSADTAYIAFVLACLAKGQGIDIDIYRVTTLALFHDCSEVLTGDMPTPVKYFNEDIRKLMKNIETLANRKIIESAPRFLETYLKTAFFFSEDSMYEHIVKLADKLSAYIKCVIERSTGNTEFLQAEGKLQKMLEEDTTGLAKKFLDEFLEAYTQPIDLNLESNS